MPRATRAAAALERELGLAVELERGSGGVFTVEVDGDIVARKTREGFPDERQIVEAVRGAVKS